MTQAERLNQATITRVALNLEALSEATFMALDALNDESIVSDAERGFLIDACATLTKIAMRAAHVAQQKSARER